MKSIIIKSISSKAVFVLLAFTLSACSFGGKGIDYKSVANREAPLEIPPQLSTPAVDDRFTIPGGKPGSATFSTYNKGTTENQPVAAGVLPPNTVARLVRDNQQRYVVVNLDVEQVWPIVRNFWPELGFTYKVESQPTGLLETDWAENRAKIPMDPIRSVIGKAFDGIYSTSVRDRFRTRLERNTVDGKPVTEIYISHRGVKEVYVNEAKDQTKWNPNGPDLDLEVEMLNRLVNKFGIPTGTQTAAAGATTASTTAAATLDPSGTKLVVSERVERAWRRVGLALDRGGFTVEDRDRSKSTFYVRYIDPDFESLSTDNKGILDKLAFWRSSPKPADRPAYRVVLQEQGEGTEVVVQDPQGKADSSAIAKRMLVVLNDQLR